MAGSPPPTGGYRAMPLTISQRVSFQAPSVSFERYLRDASNTRHPFQENIGEARKQSSFYLQATSYFPHWASISRRSSGAARVEGPSCGGPDGTPFAALLAMKDAVVILNSEAIPAARDFCSALQDYEVLLFDPVLGDKALAAKLQNVQVITQIDVPAFVSIDREAQAAARALEEALDATQFGSSGVSILAWQHLNFSLIFTASLWHKALWQSAGGIFKDRRIHIPVSHRPAQYYFDSFVPASILIEYLRGQRVEYVIHEYGIGSVWVDTVPDLTGIAPGGGPEWLLTYLPTCVYDHAYFVQEMRAAGKRIVNLQAKLWDVPVEADRTIGLTPPTRLLASLSNEARERIATACEALSQNLDPLLTPHIPSSDHRARQTEHIVSRYRGQFATYFGLERYFQADAPGKLVLSEHDTGFHGPLVSFAESRSLPVILVPHSKVMGDVEFGYRNIVALTHPMQGTSIHDRYDRPVIHHTVAYPEDFCSTSTIGNGLRSMSLMLNSTSLNGVHFTPTVAYLDGIKRIVTWCRDNNVDLKIRCKPGFTLFGLLRAYVGAPPDLLARNVNETMDEHVKGCDLCLMYDMATSGSLFFLRRSLPVLNPIVAELNKTQRSLLRPDLIVPESVEATLHRLSGFRAEPLSLYSFRTAQFQAFLGGFAQARPLRSFL